MLLDAQGFDNYITASGDKLMDGEQEFRFLSFNIPNLNYVEDEMSFTTTNPYGLPTEFEIRDAMESVRQMGGRVIRIYTIPVRNDRFPAEAVTYVEGPGQFNEEAFKSLDMVLALANEYGIRLIFPLLNNWQWMGGVPNYAAFRGKGWNDFWNDEELINDFKQTVYFVLNRTNTITGVKYKDDKAILCWETGNELQGPHSWTVSITRYIKSLDSNHLIMDGYHAINDLPIREESIMEQSIDIITSHHYELDPLEMTQNVQRKVAQVNGRKPYVVGEIGFISTSGMEVLLDSIIENPLVTGALTWSLRYHHKNGGFYWHTEPVGLGIYKAYHWPGFHSGQAYDERNFLRMWRDKAFAIQGLEAPPVPKPKAPKILPFHHPHHISWQGSAGAVGYNMERATAPNGPWQMVGYHLSDAAVQNFPLYHDKSAKLGVDYYYRLFAVNESGHSDASKVVGPVRYSRQAIVDNMSNFGTLYSSREIKIETGEDRSYKEIMYRASGKRGSQIVYSVPGSFASLQVFAFEKREKPRLQIYGSRDGDVFFPLDAKVLSFNVGEDIYDYARPKRYTVAATGEWKFVRIEFLGEASIGRVELEYGSK